VISCRYAAQLTRAPNEIQGLEWLLGAAFDFTFAHT
jgi:hypothetical protein